MGVAVATAVSVMLTTDVIALGVLNYMGIFLIDKSINYSKY